MRGSKREKRPGVWELRVHVGPDPVTGKPRYLSKTVHGGPRIADKELARMFGQLTDEQSAATSATFGSLVDQWLEHLESVGRSPTTLRGYRSKIESAIRPALGEIKLSRLGPADLDKFYRSRVTQGNSSRTITGMHRVISSALTQGVCWGWISSNPALRATPPTAPMREILAPTPEELQTLLGAALQE